MLDRVLEPEVMNTSEEATDYDKMDHRQVNRSFVDDFLTAVGGGSAHSDGQLRRVFDAGTGTAQIPIELVQRFARTVVVASDLADQMLAVARRNVAAAGLESRIELLTRDCKKLPEADDSFDAVISNSIIHHIPEPKRVLEELWRILKPGGTLFVRDLVRPDDAQTLEQLVTRYTTDASDHQQQMFRDSLYAALTIDEVRKIAIQLGLSPESIKATSDRHWTLSVRKHA